MQDERERLKKMTNTVNFQTDPGCCNRSERIRGMEYGRGKKKTKTRNVSSAKMANPEPPSPIATLNSGPFTAGLVTTMAFSLNTFDSSTMSVGECGVSVKL